VQSFPDAAAKRPETFLTVKFSYKYFLIILPGESGYAGGTVDNL